MDNEIDKKKREQRIALISQQTREVFKAGDTEELAQAANRILDRASSIGDDVLLVLVQLKVIAQMTGQDKEEENLQRLISSFNLEGISMRVIYEGYPEILPEE